MLTIRNSIANAIVDLVSARMEQGSAAAKKLIIYNGPRPAAPEVPSIATTLAIFDLPNSMLPAATISSMVARSSRTFDPPLQTNGLIDGLAQWFRVLDKDGVALIDGDVSDNTGSAECKIDNIAIGSGRMVRLLSWTASYPQ